MLSQWSFPSDSSLPQTGNNWLLTLLARNSETAYLRDYGGPKTLQQFRKQVPVCTYDHLGPYLERMQGGEENVLFPGVPIAYERTGGSTRGPKLIPYSREGLLDFQRNIVPWLAHTLADHGITGRVYFSTSPATRRAEFIGRVPVGVSDAAYLGEHAGAALAAHTAVPFEVAAIADTEEWRKTTIRYLAAARDLELISVWSPTFLLRLLEHIPDAARLWPRLKVVSCWASGSSSRYASEIRRLLPHAAIQPKGLLSTEAVITVPDRSAKPILVSHGFVEFAQGDALFLEDELEAGETYEVVATTASGLYRYRSGDRVVYGGTSAEGRPILEFVGRNSLTCDLVGEKLVELFVAGCLEVMPGFALLVPDMQHPGYVLVCEQRPTPEQLDSIELRLGDNPQYAYARKLGQLAPLRVIAHASAASAYEQQLMDRGTRLGDIKPVALRNEPFWLPYFMEALQ